MFCIVVSQILMAAVGTPASYRRPRIASKAYWGLDPAPVVGQMPTWAKLLDCSIARLLVARKQAIYDRR
jgi:hypothetical protein